MARSEKRTMGSAISFRLPDDKHAAYLAIAKRAGTSIGAVVRQCVIDANPQILIEDGAKNRRAVTTEEMERMVAAASVLKKTKPPKTSEEKRRLLYLVNKTSNNMNQLAHRANAEYNAGVLSESTFQSILRGLELTTRYLKAVVRDAD